MEHGFTVAWSFGNTHDTFLVKGVYNSDEQMRSTSVHIQRAANTIDTWCLRRKAKCLMSITTEGVFMCSPEFIKEVEELSKEIREYTQLPYSMGVGLDVQEALFAMQFGLKTDKPIALFAEAKDAQPEDEDEIEKSESVQAITGTLSKLSALLKSNQIDLPVRKNLSAIAVHLTELLEKKFKLPMRKSIKPPPAPPAQPYAPVAGTIKDGKIKVKPIDPQTGEVGETGWNGARAGMIRSKGDTAISSRQPETT